MTDNTHDQLSSSPASRSVTTTSPNYHEGDPDNEEPSALERGLSSLELEDGSAQREPEHDFSAVQCLFCNKDSGNLEENLGHMLKKHGLFIPASRLQVDFETFVKYLHLVIYGYFECLFCGSQRHNAQAVRQHMLDRGHCKIDLASEDSEFRDFYDYESDSSATGNDDTESDDDDDDDGGDRVSLEGNDNVRHPKTRRDNVEIVETGEFMRLSSGKILSHRSQTHASHSSGKVNLKGPRYSTHTPAAPSQLSGTTSALQTSGPADPGSSKRVAKRQATFINQLASLRSEDRRSLMHLPISKQRALVMKSKKQTEQARREENEMRLKIQLKANRSIKS